MFGERGNFPLIKPLNKREMFTLQAHQESQEYKSLEMRESTWEPDGSLYTDVQLGSNHQTESLPNREVSTISNLYHVHPDVFNHPVAEYPPEISTLTRYDSPSTLYIDRALGFPMGTLQADGGLEAQYRSPITDEFPPFEGYPNMDSPSTRGSGDLSISPAQTILQTAEHPEKVGNEEEGQEKVVLHHSGGGTWKCAICAKSFRRRQRAVLHVLNKHNNIRLRCNGKCGAAYCDRSFATQEGLDVHTRPSLVECKSCGKSMLKKNLHRHSKLHCPKSSMAILGE